MRATSRAMPLPTVTPLTAPLSPALMPPSPTLLALARRGVTRSDAEGLASTRTGIAAASSAGKAKLTDNKHHANAMLLNEEQSRKLKASRTASLGNKLVTAVTALTMTAARTASSHWAITLVTLQCLMPRLNPRLRGVALHCLAMLKSTLFSLGSQLSMHIHSLAQTIMARVALKVAPALITWSGITTLNTTSPEAVNAVSATQETIESLGQRVFMHGQASTSNAPKGAETGRLLPSGAPSALVQARSLIGDASTGQDRINESLRALLKELNVKLAAKSEAQAVASPHAALATPMRTVKQSTLAMVKEYGASRSTYYEWVRHIAQLDEYIANNANRATAVIALRDMAEAKNHNEGSSLSCALQPGATHSLPPADTTAKRTRAEPDARTHAFIGTTGDPDRPVRLTLVAASQDDSKITSGQMSLILTRLESDYHSSRVASETTTTSMLSSLRLKVARVDHLTRVDPPLTAGCHQQASMEDWLSDSDVQALLATVCPGCQLAVDDCLCDQLVSSSRVNWDQSHDWQQSEGSSDGYDSDNWECEDGVPGCSCGLHKDADQETCSDLTEDESGGESSCADMHDASISDDSTAPLDDPGSEGFHDWHDYLGSIAPGEELSGPAHGTTEAYPIGLMPLGVEPLSTIDRLLVAAARGIDTLPGYAPALSDNGASDEASCSRSLDGAILSSRTPDGLRRPASIFARVAGG